jgi:hypothetical protein
MLKRAFMVRRGPLEIVDLVLACLVWAFNVVIHAGLIVESPQNPAHLATFTFGMIPVGLLCLPTPAAMIAAAFMGLPCFILAGVMCDISDNPTSDVLHAGGPWLVLLTPYGILRAVLLSLSPPAPRS